jgi:hypothetical protein
MDVYQRRRLVALSALAGFFILVVLLVRSCGDDEEPTPVAPLAGATGPGGATALSQADYIDQADSICLDANNALAEVDQSDLEAAAADEQQILEGELQQLQTLPPPEDDRERLDKFLGGLDEQVTALSDRVTAAERGDTAAVADLDATVDAAAVTAAKSARRFGFEVCGDTSAVGESSGEGEESVTGGTETVVPEATAPPATTTVPPPTDTATEGGVGTAPPADTGDTGDSGGTASGSGGVSP